MFEKIKDWMNFHSAVMQRYPNAGYLMLFSSFIEFLIIFYYPRIIIGLANFKMGPIAPFQAFIIDHLYYFRLGMWFIPLLIYIVLMTVCWDVHLKNVKKFNRF